MQSGPDGIAQGEVSARVDLDQRLAELGFANFPPGELPAVHEAWAAICEHSALLAQHTSRRGS